MTMADDVVCMEVPNLLVGMHRTYHVVIHVKILKVFIVDRYHREHRKYAYKLPVLQEIDSVK